MKRIIYKLKFKTGVHFGNGSLSESNNNFQADTLFSALCIEALNIGGEEKLNKFIEYAKKGKFKISDSFPYIDKTLFIPKPFMPLDIKEDRKSDSKEKKAYKKLKYIPVDKIDSYLKGDLDVLKTNKEIKELGKYDERNIAAVRREEDAEPYYLGIYRFSEKGGLYIIVEFEEENYKNEFEELLKSLSYTGIGGKVSSGLGKFTFEEEKIPNKLEKRLDNIDNSKIKMSLSLCIPENDKIDDALENAYYRIEKRSGFVYSTTYSDTLMRKKDLYVIQSGGCFEKIFEGEIVDVSINGAHPVYRYAKPLFMEVI